MEILSKENFKELDGTCYHAGKPCKKCAEWHGVIAITRTGGMGVIRCATCRRYRGFLSKGELRTLIKGGQG